MIILIINVIIKQKTLSIECCSETSINLVFMSNCYFTSIFYSIADVFYTIIFIFFVTFHSMSHVRLSYV